MQAMTPPAAHPAPGEIHNQRFIPGASAEALFDAFANPALLHQWWGPHGFRNTLERFEFRPGGAWLLTMHGPDGAAYPNESEIIEFTRPSQIRFQHLRPMHWYEMDMAFANLPGGASVTWRMRFDPPEEGERLRPFIQGANDQNLERLEALLRAGDPAEVAGRERTLARFIQAPPAPVFQAWINAATLVQWWGSHSSMPVECRTDAFPGGVLLLRLRDDEGRDQTVTGTFLEMVENTRLEMTLRQQGSDSKEAPETRLTVLFDPHGAGTLLQVHLSFASLEERLRQEQRGLIEPWEESLDCLAALLARAPQE